MAHEEQTVVHRPSSFEGSMAGALTREASRGRGGLFAAPRPDFAAATDCTLSGANARSISQILEAIGKPGFYDVLADRVAAMLGCDRYLAMRYSRFAKPVFLVNSFMHGDFERFYLDELYHLDPLYLMIRDGRHCSVSTLLGAQDDERSAAYRNTLFDNAAIADELALVLPVFGGMSIAICLDRTPGSSAFDGTSVALAMDLYAVIKQANLLHLERSLPGGGFGLLEGAATGVLVTTPEHEVVCKNEAWNNLERSALSAELKRIMAIGCVGKKIRFGERVVHGYRLGANNPVWSNGNIFFVDSRCSVSSDVDVEKLLEGVATRYRLSPRERDLFTMALDGCGTRAIADRLCLSVGTIKNCKLRLYAKLGIKSEREMASLLIGFLGRASTAV